jgi:hypothetical protein
VSKQYALFLWAVAGSAFLLGAGGTLLLWPGQYLGPPGVPQCVSLLGIGSLVGLSAGFLCQSHFDKTGPSRDCRQEQQRA